MEVQVGEVALTGCKLPCSQARCQCVGSAAPPLVHSQSARQPCRFRFALTDSPRALTKLLKCVDWTDPRESAHARQIAESWAPPDIGDLLELLGPAFVSAPAWVRQCAVDALKERASDAQLVAYLLPLVQVSGPGRRGRTTYPCTQGYHV